MFGRAASWIYTRATLETGFESGDISERSDCEPRPLGASSFYAGGVLSGVQTDLPMRVLTGTSREIPMLYNTKRRELGMCRGVGC